MAKFSRAQLGTTNKKNYSRGSGKINKTRTPWGKAIVTIVGKRAKGVSGSAVRKSSPAPSLAPQTAGYPANKPYAWPTIPDTTGYTHPPSPSGNNTNTIARHNASVNNAYTRAGYP